MALQAGNAVSHLFLLSHFFIIFFYDCFYCVLNLLLLSLIIAKGGANSLPRTPTMGKREAPSHNKWSPVRKRALTFEGIFIIKSFKYIALSNINLTESVLACTKKTKNEL